MNRLFRRWRLYGDALLHREFAKWLWRRVWLDDIPGRAAQLSYYFLLALFPLLICLSALLGYFVSAEATIEQRLLEYLGSVMPGAAFDVVRATMDDLVRTGGGGKVSFGLLAALWMASSGMEAGIEGLNVAFQVEEARAWWRRRLVALGLIVAVALLSGCRLCLALAGGASERLLTELLGLGGGWSPLWHAARWTVSNLFLLFSIAVVYTLGPNLKTPRKGRIIVPGAIIALICWITASAGLRLYLDHFSSFGRTYGSLGAVIALLIWLYLTGAALLLGAEINSGIQARLNETLRG